MSRGVLYVSTGEKFFDRAVESVTSLHRTNDIPASVITSPELASQKDCTLFDEVIELEHVHDDVRDKQFNLDKSPYDKTLFLDDDITIIEDISPVFDLLDRVDIAGASADYEVMMTDVPDSLPELNTGVLAYNKAQTGELFSKWKTYQRDQLENGRPRPGEKILVKDADTLDEAFAWGNMWGQTTFREALYKSDIKFSVLPAEYNYGRARRNYAKHNKVRILHGYLRDELEPIINDRLTERILVGETLYYPSEGEEVQLKGMPTADKIISTLYLREITQSLGIHQQSQRVYNTIEKTIKSRD